MKRNTWTLVSNHRAGSTVVCQYIGFCQSAANYDELFHPNAAMYGDGPHGPGIWALGDPFSYYRSLLLRDDWVIKAIPVHVFRHPSVEAEAVLSLLAENTARWVVLTRKDTFNQFVSFLLMGMVGFHHRTPAPQPEWNFKIRATKEQYDHFCDLNSHFDVMLRALADLKIEHDRICYEEVFSSAHAFSDLSSILRLEKDAGEAFLHNLGVCQKLTYDHESCLVNPEEVRTWIARSETRSTPENPGSRPSSRLHPPSSLGHA